MCPGLLNCGLLGVLIPCEQDTPERRIKCQECVYGIKHPAHGDSDEIAESGATVTAKPVPLILLGPPQKSGIEGQVRPPPKPEAKGYQGVSDPQVAPQLLLLAKKRSKTRR